MTQKDILILFLVLSAIWTAIWFKVILSIPNIQPEEEVTKNANTLRRRLAFPMIATLVILLTAVFYWSPYPIFREHTIGKPEVTVNVNSFQWGWILDADTLPVHKVVEFNVTSRDVNHGFAIYNSEGRLVAQTQAMPGYVNKLIFKFDEPGEYTIRCLEYCGVSHHVMLATFTVD
ncbi:MAG TPA: hypothetical protein PLM89_07795 [Anaerolineales bacterium]|nr:hypothetical protein [Anaerolineales bacterium]